MEKSGYRENLELIAKAYPGRGALNTEETASYLGISTASVRRLAASGAISVRQDKGVRKKIIIPVDSVARYLAG